MREAKKSLAKKMSKMHFTIAENVLMQQNILA